MSMAINRALRVLMVTPRYFPDMGGIETHVHEVGRRLVRTGIDVTVLTTVSPALRAQLPCEAESEGMEIIRVPAWPHTGDSCIAPQLYRRLLQAGSWDLIHCQGIHTAVPALAMMAAIKARIPFVLTFHSGGHSSSLRNSTRHLQWRALRPLLAHAEELIGVSQFETNYFRKVLRLQDRRFTVIPNGATLPVVSQPSGRSEKALIISVGRLERYKGHQHLITALPQIRAKHPDARLLILGAGPYEASLRRLARRTGVAEHVEIRAVPGSDRQAMATLLSRAALVALLSEYESQGIAVMEALALGRPVLGTHTAGLQELAEQGLIRTIPLRSTPEVVAEATLQQIEMPLTPKRITLPTWDGCADKLLAVYERVCGTTRQQAA